MTPRSASLPLSQIRMLSSYSGQPRGDINLHSFARRGMNLLGRVQAAQGKQIILAPDLEENLTRADAFERQIMQRIDEYIGRTGKEAEANREAGEVSSNGAATTNPC